MIVSDKTWLPWELMVLSNDREEGPFLGMAFQVSHWLKDSRKPARSISWENPAWVTSPGQSLAALEEISSLLNRPFTVLADYEGLRDAMRSGTVDLWQFLGHNHRLQENRDESYFLLARDKQFTPQSLSGPARNMGEQRPLVFMASCGSGIAGESLVGAGGWPKRFLDAGAGIFIGTLWEITPAEFYLFADEFYRSLAEGEEAGTAFLRGRHALYDPDREEVTHLAFTYFGDPHARLVPRDEPEPKQGKTIASPRPGYTRVPWSLRLSKKARQLLVGLGVLASVLLIFWLGVESSRMRERMVGIEPLSYPVMDHFVQGFAQLGNTVPRAFGALLSDKGAIRWGSWAVLVLCALSITSHKRESPWLKRVLLGMLALVLAMTLFYTTLVVSAESLAVKHGNQLGFSENLADRIVFEARSWLVNDSARNDRRRNHVAGLAVWTLIGAVVGIVCIRFRDLGWRSLGIVGFLVVVVLSIRLFPAAHAYAAWGLEYPEVTLSREAMAAYGLDADAPCCLFDVSAGSKNLALWVVCPDSEGMLRIFPSDAKLEKQNVGLSRVIVRSTCSNPE